MSLIIMYSTLWCLLCLYRSAAMPCTWPPRTVKHALFVSCARAHQYTLTPQIRYKFVRRNPPFITVSAKFHCSFCICMQDGCTALFLAAENGHTHCVRELLRVGVDVDLVSKVLSPFDNVDIAKFDILLLLCTTFPSCCRARTCPSH